MKHDPFQTVKHVVSTEGVPEKRSGSKEWTGLGLLLDIMKPFCNSVRGQPKENAWKTKEEGGNSL